MKHTLLIIMATILSVGLQNAQSSEYTWANQINGFINDSGNWVAMDRDGNVFVTGVFIGTLTIGTETLESSGSYASFIIKYDSNGNLLWARNSENNICFGVSTDEFGNCFITGNFYDSTTFDDWTLTSSGSKDIYLVKFDPNGNVIWAKKAGGIDYDSGTAIAVNNLGEIFISGYFEGTVYFDSVILTNPEPRVFILPNMILMEMLFGLGKLMCYLPED